MFCSSCGAKMDADWKFCTSCGQTIPVTNPSVIAEISTNDDVPKQAAMPMTLMRCSELRIQGKTIVFKNELDETVVTVMKTGKGLIPSSLDYLDGSTGEPFMSSRFARGRGIRHEAFDREDQPIGAASYLIGLKYAIKTIVTIETAEGETFLLEENVRGLGRKIAKIIGSVMDTNILFSRLLGDRTGDLIIKRGRQTIGVVRSIRQSRFNTYIVENCDQLRSQLDLRLIVLGLTMKQLNTK